jgi:predicted PurR-regulated permease PerM
VQKVAFPPPRRYPLAEEGHRNWLHCLVPDLPDIPPPPSLPPPPPPPGAQWQARFFQFTLIGCGLYLAIWLIFRLSVVTTPILFGFFVAYALNPVVIRLRRWRVPSFLALTVPVLLFVSLAVVFFTVVVPQMAQKLQYASSHLPQLLFNQVLRMDPWFEAHFAHKLSDFVPYQVLSQVLQSLAKEIVGREDSTVVWILSSAKDLLLAIGNLVLIVVVAFFLLEDYEKIVRGAASLVPRRHSGRVLRIITRIDGALAGFLRGELLLMTTAIVSFTVGLLALDVPFALLMGPIAGVIYLVPYLGVLTGATLCVLMSLLTDHSSWQIGGVAVLFGLFYSVDLLFITPRIIGNRVGLKPVVVLLGIIAMGELAGLTGILLALPLLAVTRILLDEAITDYRLSATFSRDYHDS